MAEVFLQKNADIYITIAESTQGSTNPKIVLENKKINHPGVLLKLGNRFRIYFKSTSTSTYFFAPNGDKYGRSIDRTLKIKIGQVTDTTLLKLIKANKAQGFTKLLDYAKKVTNYNYVGTIKYIGKTLSGSNVPTSEMNLTDGAYYFAYIELDDENGVYYPVEDIALYRAKGTTDLVRYSDKEFVWEIAEEPKQPTEEEPKPEEPKKEEEPKQEQPEKKTENVIENTIGDTTNNTEKVSDSTTAKGSLPQTGESAILLIVVLLAGLAGIGYVKYKKYQDIK